MRIYISSTQADLAEYRVQVAQALRQIGHTVLHMEEYTAEESRPLDKCVQHVATADVYVGIFAWRYGHIPKANRKYKNLPSGIVQGKTSITHAEYFAAEKIPRLIFILDESVPWQPPLMDAHTQTDGGKQIRDLRTRLSEKHMVSFFKSPDNLAKEVLAAVRKKEISAQMELKSLQQADAHRWMMNPESTDPYALQDTTMMTITEQLQKLDDETYMIINIGSGLSWWSTRVYFLACLLVDLSEVRLLVFVDKDKRLIGVSSALAVRDIFGGRIVAIRRYEENLKMQNVLPDLQDELNRRGMVWEAEMQAVGGEKSVKTWVRKQELRRFLGDSLIQRAVDWSPDERNQQNSVLDIVDQIIKWPQNLVPIVQDRKFYKVVERDALTEEVANIFLNERLRTSI